MTFFWCMLAFMAAGLSDKNKSLTVTLLCFMAMITSSCSGGTP